jgi:hypothetical protein
VDDLSIGFNKTFTLDRGLSALKEVGLDEHVKTDYGIPMYARLIHNRVSKEHK